MAIREGSLKDAARRLSITPAAVGQRIRAIEEYLGTDLLLRGRSGLQPTVELDRAMADLRSAFAALDRVTQTLDFQRVAELHIVADLDLSDLWLLPRLAGFRAENPNILFCINGEGDVPARLGAPDCRIEYGAQAQGEELFTDRFLPVTGPDNLRRVADWDAVMDMEGMPLVHLERARDDPDLPGWPEWIAQFGHRREGADRGVHYRHLRLALEAVRQNVGFLICGLALAADDLAEKRIFMPFGPAEHMIAPHPYRLVIREGAEARPQLQRFADWLRCEAAETARYLSSITDS